MSCNAEWSPATDDGQPYENQGGWLFTWQYELSSTDSLASAPLPAARICIRPKACQQAAGGGGLVGAGWWVQDQGGGAPWPTGGDAVSWRCTVRSSAWTVVRE